MSAPALGMEARPRPPMRINLQRRPRAEWGGAPEAEEAFGRLVGRLMLRIFCRDERKQRARELWAKRDGRAEVRAAGACEICGFHADGHASRSLHVHHIRPRALGTNNRASNLMALCATCHGLAHALFGNTDPGGRLRLWTALLIARSAVDEGKPLDREAVLRAVDAIEAKEKQP